MASTNKLQARPGDPCPPRRSQLGFTLVEIMLVLAIMGLMLGTLTVNMGGLTPPARVKAAARSLAGMSEYVRSQASGSKTLCYLDIDFDHNSYRWRTDPPEDALGRMVDPDDERLLMTNDKYIEWMESFRWEQLPRDVYFVSLWFNATQFVDKDLQTVTYFPDGTVKSYILWIKAVGSSDEEIPLSVVVNGLTGKSEVASGHLRYPTATESDFSQVIGDGLGGGR